MKIRPVLGVLVHNQQYDNNANAMIKNWIDWMKVLGMFAIIWGHYLPTLFSDLFYAFSEGNRFL